MEISNKIIERLCTAKKVSVLTGAGISAESGIKTFRDPDGLWSKFNPAELASMNGFMSNPSLVWDWYQYRREIIYNSKPNPGHYAIAEMQNIFDNFTLITQNVDRLHQKAGSVDVIELHGNIIENYCARCRSAYNEIVNSETKEVPKCHKCDGLIRPAVVWFGEMLPEDAIHSAAYAASNSEVFFSIGTSAEVYPAANLPVTAKRNGALTIEINPNETAISGYMDFCLREPSGVVLPKIIEEVKKRKEK